MSKEGYVFYVIKNAFNVLVQQQIVYLVMEEIELPILLSVNAQMDFMMMDQ
jgi:hypothetical protein